MVSVVREGAKWTERPFRMAPTHWTRCFTCVLSAALFGPANLPTAVVEASTGPQVAQASGVSTAIPAEVQGWFDGAKAAAARGDAAEALRLQKQVVAWLEGHPGAPVLFRALALINLGFFLTALVRKRRRWLPQKKPSKRIAS